MVLVYGTVCIDRFLQVKKLPVAGGYVEVDFEMLALGGEAANTAVALGKWGTKVELTTNSVGFDADGATLNRLMAEQGLAVVNPNELTARTPVCDVIVTPDGDRTMFGHGFRDMTPSVQTPEIEFRPGHWFTAEPNMADPARAAVAAAGAAGMRCYAMDFARSDEILPPDSYWQSSTDWCGHRANAQRNVQWLNAWVERHGCFGILSDGPNGFVAGSPTMPVRSYPPYPAPKVVDATGAGDMFRAGMLHGLDQGWEVARCLQFASAAGCLKCRSLGAIADVPTVVEIDTHINAYPEVSERYR